MLKNIHYNISTYLPLYTKPQIANGMNYLSEEKSQIEQEINRGKQKTFSSREINLHYNITQNQMKYTNNTSALFLPKKLKLRDKSNMRKNVKRIRYLAFKKIKATHN